MRLEVDRIACRGHGLCAGLLPEAVSLDDWGYPVVAAGVPDELRRAARRAVAACPTLALRMVRPAAAATPATLPARGLPALPTAATPTAAATPPAPPTSGGPP